ncbi:hypothetical protein ES703_97543 [subsurface metagenome]
MPKRVVLATKEARENMTGAIREAREMETETMARDIEKKWVRVRVQIQLSTGVCSGYVHCPSQHRLLHVLNRVSVGGLWDNEEFLSLSQAEMHFPDGREAAPTYINKAIILFVKEMEDGQTRGLGGKAGHRLYPFVAKSSTRVRLYMPAYTLTGKMHYPKGKSTFDVLHSELRFIPLTDVEISPSAGTSESGVSFIAVNKGQILSSAEPGE